MIGLLYRELYLQRKSITALISVFFVFIGLMLLVYLSLQCGNLGILYNAEDKAQMTEVIRTINTYFPAFLIMMMPAESFEIVASDYRVGWMRFQRCLPCKPEQYAAVKIILMAAELLLGLLLGLGNAYISSLVFGLDLDFSGTLVLILLMMTLCCTMSMLSILLTLLLRSKNGNAAGILIIALYVGAMIALMLMPDSAMEKLEHFLNGDGNDELTIAGMVSRIAGFLKTLLPWCISITAGVLIGGFFAMTALFKRREN